MAWSHGWGCSKTEATAEGVGCILRRQLVDTTTPCSALSQTMHLENIDLLRIVLELHPMNLSQGFRARFVLVPCLAATVASFSSRFGAAVGATFTLLLG